MRRHFCNPTIAAWKRPWLTTLVAAISFSAAFTTSVHGGLVIEFDYTYDSTGYFGDPARRAALQQAADSVNRWVDNLAPIVPGGGNTWTGQIVRPDTGIGVLIPGGQLNVPADILRIYVGAHDLGGNHLAVANKNGTIASGTSEWVQLVKFRGQTPGPPHVDYGPWGGSIAFNPNFDWYSGADPSGLGATQYDLFSAASHEILHVLGFGLAESYNAQIEDGDFVGPNAMAVGSPNNPTLAISPDGGHWLLNTQSTIAGLTAKSVISPFLLPGERLRMTDLDAAAIDDIGWELALAGDVDLDRDVDFADAFALVNNYGTLDVAGWRQGDFNGNGHVDFDDAFVQVNNYGGSLLTALGIAADERLTLASINEDSFQYRVTNVAGDWVRDLHVSVPEPTTNAALIALAFWSLRFRRGATTRKTVGTSQ